MARLFAPRIPERAVQIRISLIEGRIEETDIRLLHAPVLHAAQEGLGLGVIAEPLAKQFHRTNRKFQEGVHILRAVA